MSQDGADLGVDAARALDTVLGGKEQPTEDEKRTPQQMEVYLRAVSDSVTDNYSYSDSARLLAKRMLLLVLAHSEINWEKVPADRKVNFHDSGDPKDWEVLTDGIGEVWKKLDPEGYRQTMDQTGPTGFQFGWAWNAVRYCCELGPVANPAILTVGE